MKIYEISKTDLYSLEPINEGPRQIFGRTGRSKAKGNFSTNFVLQQKTGMYEKKVIRGKLSSKLSGSFVSIKMKSPMTPHYFFLVLIRKLKNQE